MNGFSDGISILGHLFLGGPRPSMPGPSDSGEDPSDDELGCEAYAPPCM